MRVEKKGRWKAVLAALCAVALLLLTYLTLVPGGLFLPGLRWSVYAADGEGAGLRHGSAVAVSEDREPSRGLLVAYRRNGDIALGRVSALQDGQIEIATGAEGMETVEESAVLGVAEYEIYALGSVIGVLAGEPGRYLVWAADALYVFILCIWLMTLPGRRSRRRKRELIRLFESYGAKYDMEEEGLDY